MGNTSEQLIETACRRILESEERIEKCVNFLSEEQIWHRFNKETPSIGDLILHLKGNIDQWVTCSFSNKPDQRKRGSEFNNEVPIPANDLLVSLKSTITEALDIITSLNEAKLTARYKVQCFEENGIDILVHVVEHLSYHTGQIALHTKILAAVDLGFYEGQDLNSTQPTKG